MSWRDELKEGDEVIVNSGGFVRLTTTPSLTLATVDRVTDRESPSDRRRSLRERYEGATK